MKPDEIRQLVIATRNPQKLFGSVDSDKIRKKLLFICHPDQGGTDESFERLAELWDEFSDPGNFDPIPLREDDITVSSEEGAFEVKRLKANDTDLLDIEAGALDSIVEFLEATPDFDQHFPILEAIDAREIRISYPNNLLPSSLVTLEELRNHYQNDLDIRHLGWIWRRLVLILGMCHGNGMSHGGILPNAVLIGPQHHDVILTNWYNTAHHDEAFSFISNTWSHLYPDLSKVRPEVDIFMAAKTMLWAFPQMPEELHIYFNVLSMNVLNGVIYNTETLIAEFDRRIYKMLGWRKEFVRLEWLDYSALHEELLK